MVRTDSPSTVDHRLSPDATWRSLYRVGALAAGAAVVLYIAALILFSLSPAPPPSGGAAMLEYVDANRSSYIIRQVLWLVPNIFLMLVMLALAVALAPLGKSFAATAGTVAVTSWAVGLAWPTTGDGSLAMVRLSDEYASATTDAARAPFVAGAEVLIALNDVPSVIGVLQTVGVLLVALLMVRGGFAKGLAWVGVATGIIGIGAEALRPLLGWAYAIYGVMLFVWLIWIALALWQLGTRSGDTYHTDALAGTRA